ncbi:MULTISPECIES: nuclear transport factor 2 family protein [Streptomyces]|uniref:Nuclear transport factor 2 family protein n=1 Tax=Streptomyces koelreuteriae TaxID=2838015 RepID=A0ABX8FS53_9ACTN|nr:MULTISPECIES: nuclear transport factor 2 family protein [Streptomyces]QWB24004.1 nuclear transport factor 2 family protein [Streptomyces koelreuteriae]UUA06987.1 nuclear transport factor 2 family protein [Streptomyces koelreuteriae]UUA14616.1 nuclear transport factor 2 family protein [Streptomyces sp. CRCS-T-1]
MNSTDIQQFYARHMQLLDGGAAEAWAGTFTPDAEFKAPSMTEPVRGRDGIAAGARAAVEGRAAAGETHRHWVTMTTARDTGVGIETVSYVQILATPRGGAPRVELSCVMRDRLVRRDGELLVAERHITRDDRPAH